MKKWVIGVAGLAVAGLAAAALLLGYVQGTPWAARRAAQALVADSMKDPWSARWKDVQLVDLKGQQWVCGRVNGKNANGAYAGWQQWLVSPKGDVQFPVDQSELSAESSRLDADDQSLTMRGKYLDSREDINAWVGDVAKLRDARIAYRDAIKRELEFETFWRDHCTKE